jgi:hypothetical protein
MPAPSDSGGGLIVLDRDDTRYAHPQGHVASGSSRGNGAAAVQMHNDPTKKSNGEERKFFLSIEEDGVIGALQKLNQLLRTVSNIHALLSLTHPFRDGVSPNNGVF